MKFIKLFPFELISDTLVEAEPIYINVEKITSIEIYDDIFDENIWILPIHINKLM